LEAEKGEQSNVLSSLFTLGQLGENEETLPTLPAPQPNTLETRSQAVEEAFGDATAAHDGDGAEELVCQVGTGEKDTDGEDPFRNVEGDQLGRLDLGRPLVEGEKLVGCENVDGVDCAGNDKGNP
jgi:hypothetical protein